MTPAEGRVVKPEWRWAAAVVRPFVITALKELLNSANVYQNYSKNKGAQFFFWQT